MEEWYLGPPRRNFAGESLRGRLLRAPPARLSEASFRYDPAEPAPTSGGAIWPFPMQGLAPGPADQSGAEERGDTVVYASAPIRLKSSSGSPPRRGTPTSWPSWSMSGRMARRGWFRRGSSAAGSAREPIGRSCWSPVDLTGFGSTWRRPVTASESATAAWILHGTRGATVRAERLVELAGRPLGEVLRGSGVRAPHWERWLESSHRAAPYWDRVGLAKAMEGRPIDVLHVGGWRDFGLEASFETYGALGGSGGSGRQYLVVGPWEHNQIFGSLVRELIREGRDDRDQSAPGALLVRCLRRWSFSEGPERAIPRFLLWRSESGGEGGQWIGGDRWPGHGRSELYLSRHPDGLGRLSPHMPEPGGTASRDTTRIDRCPQERAVAGAWTDGARLQWRSAAAMSGAMSSAFGGRRPRSRSPFSEGRPSSCGRPSPTPGAVDWTITSVSWRSSRAARAAF